MTFSASVPLNSDSPGIFPAQNQTNMTRLQAILGADHQFNLTVDTNDGWHNLIHMTQQAPSGALAATGRLYVKTAGSFVQLFYMDDNGRAYQITPGIIAAVNFTSTGVNGAQTLNSAVNVSSVTRTAEGLYTVNFTTAIANANYIPVVCGMKDSSGEIISFVQGNATYSNSITTALLKIGFENRGGSARDPKMGSVIIYSAA